MLTTASQPRVLTAALQSIDNVALTSTTWAEVGLFADTDVDIDHGGWTFADASSRRRVIFPTAGRYDLDLNFIFSRTENNRNDLGIRFFRFRDDAMGVAQQTALGAEDWGYSRGISTDDVVGSCRALGPRHIRLRGRRSGLAYTRF